LDRTLAISLNIVKRQDDKLDLTTCKRVHDDEVVLDVRRSWSSPEEYAFFVTQEEDTEGSSPPTSMM
jgi:hypothetical protein